jgi:hypothetical protein
MDQVTLRTFLQKTFSEVVKLPTEELYGVNLTLSDIMTRAAGFTNSVDLMEAFARCAKATKQEFGIRLRLPAVPLSTPINEVIELLAAQVAPQGAQQASDAVTTGDANAAQ